VRTLGARQGSTPRLTFRRRLAAAAALCIATTTAAVVGASVPALALSGVSVTPSRSAAGAQSTYTINFTTTVALVIDVDTVTLVGPTGTVFPLVAADYTVGGTAPNVIPTPVSGSTPTNTVVLTTHVGIAAGAVIVGVSHVTNPAIGTPTLTVQTSKENTPATSSTYTITAATAITAVTATVFPAKVSSAVALYTVHATAATVPISGFDSITLSAPGGTSFPLAAADYTVNAGGATTAVSAPPSQTATNNVTITVPALSTGGSAPVALTVTAANVTNPAATGTTYSLTVVTTADSVAGTSANYTLIAATAVTGVSVAPTRLAAGASTTYATAFTDTTALATTDSVTIVGPSGTVFPLAASHYSVSDAGAASTTPTSTSQTTTNAITFLLSAPIVAGHIVTVTTTGVVNPSTTGLTSSTVATTQDTSPVAGSYTIAAATAVTLVTASPSVLAAATSSTYTVGFTATTALGVNIGTITLASAGTTFPAVAGSVYTVKDGGGATTPAAVGTLSAGTVTITTPVAVTASSAVVVVITGVTNPGAGSTTLSASTSQDSTPVASNAYVIAGAGGGGGPAPTIPTTPVRLSGSDRFGTAIAASAAEFPTAGTAGAVVLARSDDYPDALVGAALAAAKNAPLLFANGGVLTPATQAEIQRVLPAGGTVFLLGGTTAIPASVATSLTSLGFVPVRYAGADRFATALTVADALNDPSTVLLATGVDFPDALAAGPAAAHVHGVVLLTNGSSLTPAVTTYLATHPGTVYAIGGPAVAADPSATALSGADRYATAAMVASSLFTTPTNVGVASGTAFPDALSGGAFQAHFGGPIVLTDPHILPASTSTYLTGAKTTLVTTRIFGGTTALSAVVQTAIGTALGL
jgi:putative cell wall-binding protein